MRTLVALLLGFAVSCAHAPERGLLPRAVLADRPWQGWTLAERMAYWRVGAVDVAIVDGGRVVRRKTYGAPEGTLFQAGSISKPLTALAVLRLVQEGTLRLDAPVNELLTSWTLRDAAGKPADGVTLEQLLTHHGGVNLHGFDGYARGEPLPTPLQILEGGGNSPAVRATMPAGAEQVYSGGGYQIVQQLLQDVTGEPFDALLRRLVLDPLGMHDSTFAVPLPEALVPRAAIAHDAEGVAVPGGWREYPEQAAAALRTTAADLARLIVGLQDRSFLREDLLANLLTSRGGMGLGFFVDGRGQHLYYIHDGAVAGAQALIVALPHLGKGAVVLTNSANGLNLAPEIVRAIANEYDWPIYRPATKAVVPVEEAQLREVTGSYSDDDVRVELTVERGRLVTRSTYWRGEREVFPGPNGTFFTREGDWEMTFVRNERGNVVAMQFGPVKLPRRGPLNEEFRMKN